MKKAFFLLALLGTAGFGTAGTARADVTWEHRGTVSIGKSPVVYLKMNNAWSGQKHRTDFTFDATKMAGMMGGMGSPEAKMARAQMQVIERLDDDRLILSSSNDKTYIDEPYKSLKSRLRLNVWPVFGSDLSATDVPELTPAQRERLGQEIRAVVTPFTKKVMRNYFRALPEKRTINGLNSRGYRFTSMVNVSPEKKAGEWVRTTAEWWISDIQASDEEIQDFTRNANEIRMGAGGPTASMWLNEQFPVLWEAAPVELHQALASLAGEKGSPRFGFQGTPVQFFVTVTPPPAEAMMGGDVRFSLVLTKRDTSSVEATTFDPPTGAEKIEIEPFLGMARNFIKMSKGQLEKMLNE